MAKKKMIMGAFLGFFLVFNMSVLPNVASAATSTAGDPDSGGLVPCGAYNSGINGRCQLCHLIVGIQLIIKWGLGVMFIIGIAVITFAGIVYIVSVGNQSMMQWAKTALWYALGGVAVMLVAFVIVNTSIWFLAGGKDGKVNVGTGSGTGNETQGTVQIVTWSEFKCGG